MASEVPVLACTVGALAGQVIRVPEGGLDIGRAPENHVVIEEEGVSRFHARLLYDNGSLWLQDAGSRNGLFVNGQRVTGHQALKVGDELTIAQHTFQVRWERPQPASSSGDSSKDTVEPAPSAGDAAADGVPRKRWFWPFG